MKTKHVIKIGSSKALWRFLGSGKMGGVCEYRREKIQYSQFERNFHLVHRLTTRDDDFKRWAERLADCKNNVR